MKKTLLILMLLRAVTILASDPSISNMTAKQRYPWNGMVDIEYMLSGDIHETLALSVIASDSANGASYVAETRALSGDVGSEEGLHHIVWDMCAQGLELKSDDMVISVVYEMLPMYCVIDLSAGANADIYPVTYLYDTPAGGWTDEYKTTKIVLRRIESGLIPTRDAVITKPFYIGVFEVTQKQYELVMGANPSRYTGDMRPVECVSYNSIRGSSNGSQWPVSSLVDASSFIGKIRDKTGIEGFDIPTEAQWEYACRAGTTSKYNNGGDSVNDLTEVGRFYGNSSDGKGGFSFQHTTVGSYLPNEWGLYDMHGNVWEWCLDWYSDSLSGNDPVGPISGSKRVCRGGGISYANYCTASSRNGFSPSYDFYDFGFRIACTLPCYVICGSASACVDLRPTLLADDIDISWDVSWMAGGSSAIVVIEDNGVEILRQMGKGEHLLTGAGRHDLTYKTYVDGDVQDSVYSITVYLQWKYELGGDGAIIVDTVQKAGDVAIPAEIDGHTVTGIAANLFKSCCDLTSVTIPESVKTIGESAFAQCDGLTNVVIKSSSLDLISDNSLGLCGLLQAKFNSRFDITSSLEDAGEFSRVSGVLAAYQKVTEAPWEFSDQLTGEKYAWDESNSTIAYFGQMYMEGGKTYVFGAHFDDDVYVKVNGEVIINAGPDTKLEQSVCIGKFVCATSGWYEVEFRLGDDYGDKGSWGNKWSADFALGYRDDGSTDITQSGWKHLIDPGNGSLFRVKRGNSFEGCERLESISARVSLMETIAEAFPNRIGSVKIVWLDAESGGDADWVHDEGFACSGVVSLRSGAIANSQESWFEINVPAGGRLTFRWKASSESDGDCVFDYCYLSVNGEPKGALRIGDEKYALEGVAIGGKTDWQKVVVDIEDSGTNSIRWTYKKDEIDEGEVGEDCVWLDDIEFVERPSLSFNLAGGVGMMPDEIVELRDTVVVLPTQNGFEREDHIFNGWSDGSNVYAGGENYIVPSSNVIFTAQWTKKTFLTFDLGGGWGVAPDVIKELGGTVVNLPTQMEFERTDYVFDGWSDGANTYAGGAEYAMPSSDVVLTALWTKKTFLTFDLGGGLGITPDVIKEIVGVLVVLPNQDGFVWEDHVFNGWSDGEKTYAGGANYTVPSRDVTLTAQWTKKTFLTFDLGGGIGTVPEIVKKLGGTSITLPTQTDFAWEDHVFNGWSDGKNTYAGGTDYTVPSSDVTLVAQWIAKRFLTFVLDGGEGEIPVTIKEVPNAIVVLPSADGISKAKNTFVGWSDGTKTYLPGEDYRIVDSNVEFTAVWQRKEIEVTISSDVVENGGTIDLESATISISAEAVPASGDEPTIYYTVDGTEPTTDSFRYEGPFVITDSSVVIKAFAVSDDYFDSDIAQFSFTRLPYSLSECLDVSESEASTGGDANWSRVLGEVAHDGVAALRSGAIGDNQSTWVETKVNGAGNIGFWWKIFSQNKVRTNKHDYLSFSVDGAETAALGGGEIDWTNMVVAIEGVGVHTVRWTYVKDDDGTSSGEDCAWLDEVVWTPKTTAPTIEDDEDAKVEGDSENGYTVKPSEGKKEVVVTIPEGVEPEKVTVEVAADVETVTANGANVRVMKGEYDIAEHLDLAAATQDGVINLAYAQVKEAVVKEVLDSEKGAEVDISDPESPELTTSETKPGLTYTLLEGATLEEMMSCTTGDSKVGDGKKWTPEIKVKGGTSGFYTIKVEK